MLDRTASSDATAIFSPNPGSRGYVSVPRGTFLCDWQPASTNAAAAPAATCRKRRRDCSPPTARERTASRVLVERNEVVAGIDDRGEPWHAGRVLWRVHLRAPGRNRAPVDHL